MRGIKNNNIKTNKELWDKAFKKVTFVGLLIVAVLLACYIFNRSNLSAQYKYTDKTQVETESAYNYNSDNDSVQDQE